MKAKAYMKKVLGSPDPHDKVVELFTRFGDQGKLLDAPAGDGTISRKLRDAGFDVTAADINPHLFSAPGISCIKADLNERLPFSDGTFDFILCSNGIEHLETPFRFIRECFRMLKERGKIVITTPNLLNLKSRVAHLLVGFNLFTGRPYNEVAEYQGGDHIYLPDYCELRVNLHRNGFRILDATTHRFSHTAMIFFPLIPLVYLATWRAFRREKDVMQRERNREVLKHVLSPDLVFGKKLFIVAEKDPSYMKRS